VTPWSRVRVRVRVRAKVRNLLCCDRVAAIARTPTVRVNPSSRLIRLREEATILTSN